MLSLLPFQHYPCLLVKILAIEIPESQVKDGLAHSCSSDIEHSGRRVEDQIPEDPCFIYDTSSIYQVQVLLTAFYYISIVHFVSWK